MNSGRVNLLIEDELALGMLLSNRAMAWDLYQWPATHMLCRQKLLVLLCKPLNGNLVATDVGIGLLVPSLLSKCLPNNQLSWKALLANLGMINNGTGHSLTTVSIPIRPYPIIRCSGNLQLQVAYRTTSWWSQCRARFVREPGL